MSREFKYQEPIEEGMVVVAEKSGTGRRWLVEKLLEGQGSKREYDRLWLLRPMGPDVRRAQEHGKFNGGVRVITRTEWELRMRFRRVS